MLHGLVSLLDSSLEFQIFLPELGFGPLDLVLQRGLVSSQLQYLAVVAMVQLVFLLQFPQEPLDFIAFQAVLIEQLFILKFQLCILFMHLLHLLVHFFG